MTSGALFVLILDLIGTFAFAINGAFSAVRQVRLDIVGVVVLGVMTAVGGGIIRDILIGEIPPVALSVWYYLTVAAVGSLFAFFLTRLHRQVIRAILVLDAIGLSLFCVVGAQKALAAGLDPIPAILLGTITAVGGGTIRDMLTQQVPTILTSGLYAIPAIVGASITVLAPAHALFGIPMAVVGAIACFAIRLAGLRFRWNAPVALMHRETDSDDG